MTTFEAVIGLEVHCQLKTRSKLFCGCSTNFGAEPNFHTCPLCLGYPGVLPVLNHVAVDYAVRMGLAIEAQIHSVSVFARKQYFYPDLPKGYQITQYDLPYCTRGKLRLGSGKTIGITRIHMEEDAGKCIHSGRSSYVDLNRAGIPLIEIVSEPELTTPEEAGDYLRRLRALVRYLDISDGNMEEGSFRCDANVSVRPTGTIKLGTRCEIKNVNSFRNVEKAIAYEILRQTDLIESGEKVVQQTVHYDAALGKTVPMRTKEDSHDYRYFPDPDLRPLVLSEERVAIVRAALPELPEAKAQRFRNTFELNEYDASQLTAERELAAYFEAIVARVNSTVSPKIVANWVLSELNREINARGWSLERLPIAAEHMAALLNMIGANTISGKIAKQVFEEMCETLVHPEMIVKSRGLVQIVDTTAIRAVVDAVIGANPDQVREFLAGKDRVVGFFIGQIMRQSQGKLNPGLVNQVLAERLNELKSQGG